jgi:hypothetical protein
LMKNTPLEGFGIIVLVKDAPVSPPIPTPQGSNRTTFVLDKGSVQGDCGEAVRVRCTDPLLLSAEPGK